ncbi:MAG: hypothetical protein KME35_19935 [Aphanocapsa sp. GSE-SYN-MK-11-07L]|nr:hypothetical protein [Aphanocapsa sp. GSE-SYN-MK-11-07L]
MRRDIETKFKPQPNSLARQPVSVTLSKDTDVLVRSLSATARLSFAERLV